MAFTLVFDGDLKNFEGNPFQTDTPFGRPYAIAIGDALEEKDKLEQRIKEIDPD